MLFGHLPAINSRFFFMFFRPASYLLFARSTLAGIPPFHIPIPAQDERVRFIAVERRLLELVRGWGLSMSDEVRT